MTEIHIGRKYLFVNQNLDDDESYERIVRVVAPISYPDLSGRENAYVCVDGLGISGIAFPEELTEVYVPGTWVTVIQGKFQGDSMLIEAIEDDELTTAVNGGPMYRLVSKTAVGTSYLPGNPDDRRIVLPDSYFRLIS